MSPRDRHLAEENKLALNIIKLKRVLADATEHRLDARREGYTIDELDVEDLAYVNEQLVDAISFVDGEHMK